MIGHTRTFSRIALWNCVFFFNHTAPTEMYTLSLHDALPICVGIDPGAVRLEHRHAGEHQIVQFALHEQAVRLRELGARSEEHTSELQSQSNLVCRLLLEKKKNITSPHVRSARTIRRFAARYA